MSVIKIKKGLDIPIEGAVVDFSIHEIDSTLSAIDLRDFYYLRLRSTINIGDEIQKNTVIAEEKDKDKRIFRSPISGIVKDITYFNKRRLSCIVVETKQKEPLSLPKISDPWEFFFDSSLFQYVKMRPFGIAPVKSRKPKSIFIKALESAPFEPAAELQVQGNEHFFQKGIDFLSQFAKVELVHRLGSESKAFTEAKNCNIHQAIGPHPIANHSVHIAQINPINDASDTIWTSNVTNVIMIGKLLDNVTDFKRIVALTGSAIKKEARTYYRVPYGIPLKCLLEGKTSQDDAVIIRGEPLSGCLSSADDFLGKNDTVISTLIPDKERLPLHFFRFVAKFFTVSKSYLGHSTPITSNRSHGEARAFVDNGWYDKFMPLKIPTAELIKAVLIDDFDRAIQLGLLEVVPEDFAITSFVCPSKIEMMEIIKNGIQKIYNDFIY